ncbi:hypothetical protein [Rhodococcus artemisiae]|uniref:Uncharacterized protein n=1 Tax=Rhodococcus artemisiae TaxID=714159 RepID=A0ABU7L7G9_9NOCA|nr:hypothetical protein [Rhodococcus artemisiae]MEE2057482.1 hypothetical protein [Rhodococcus artemisiae]
MRTPESGTDLPLRDTRYRELELYPEFDFVTAWLRDYVRSTIDNARISEREYWSVVCLPSVGASDEGHRMISVHAGDQEIACLYVDTSVREDRQVGGFVTVDTRVLEQSCGADIDRITESSPALSVHRSGDQVSIGWSETPASREQFDALPWRPAAHELVRRLMQNGRNYWADAHCPQLAMFALE